MGRDKEKEKEGDGGEGREKGKESGRGGRRQKGKCEVNGEGSIGQGMENQLCCAHYAGNPLS